jgi:glycosyltransferase involved in cell wall biosynthesis
MKIALCSSFVPFVHGGYRNIVEGLRGELANFGHQVELVYLPQSDAPQLLLQQMAAYRWVDLSESADRIICFRPPAHVIPHPHKTLWFIHHIRAFYDLWDSPYRGFPDDDNHRNIRDILHRTDTEALKEATQVFTNSQIISDRIARYNGLTSEVLYPPVSQSERYHCKSFNDEIVYLCRTEHHKRQHLLIEAMRYTRTKVKLRICGTGGDVYAQALHKLIAKYKLDARIHFDNRWITEDEKICVLSECLAAAYLPLDEDSYGYPSLEASHSGKPILTTTDAGGVLELVTNKYNGLVVEPEAKALAEAMDYLYSERAMTRLMGTNAVARIVELDISWAKVVGRLLK